MYRLFMQSALAKRPKCHTTRGSIDYVQYTLKRCLNHQTVFWQSSMRVSKSRMPVGRLKLRRPCGITSLYPNFLIPRGTPSFTPVLSKRQCTAARNISDCVEETCPQNLISVLKHK